MHIGVVGLGYVGLVTAVGLAEIGHKIYCHDIDEQKMEALSQRRTPIYEIGLQEKLNHDVIFRRINVTCKMTEVVIKSDVIFVSVGTPSNEDGSANTEYVKAVIIAIAAVLNELEKPCEKYIVIKSTIPIGFTNNMQQLLKNLLINKESISVSLAFCPEFLREGTAINDFLSPERIVIGADDKKTAEHIGKIFSKFADKNVPFIYTNCVSAEMIKYTSNIMLASRVAIINEIADYAELVGGHISDISKAVGLDHRIGDKYLNASLGFGGSCLPKDIKAFSYLSKQFGLELPLIQAIFNSNEYHIQRWAERIIKIARANGVKNILVLGTAFKPGTDDIRESAAIKAINVLVASKLNITIADPKALNNTKRILGDSVNYVSNFYNILDCIDMIVVGTGWKEFSKLDIQKIKEKIKGNIIFDLCNILDQSLIELNGFKYYGIAN